MRLARPGVPRRAAPPTGPLSGVAPPELDEAWWPAWDAHIQTVLTAGTDRGPRPRAERDRDVAAVDLLIARNPDPDSTLPYLLRVPLGPGLVFRTKGTWPRTSALYCHPVPPGDWPAEPELVERVPLTSCARRGAAIDVVADRGREARSQIVFTTARGREVVFWQSPEERAAGAPALGTFTANAAWLVLAAIAFNLTRAAGALASAFHARATTGTVRAHLISVPARLARSARRLTLHLPRDWLWEAGWQELFTAVHGHHRTHASLTTRPPTVATSTTRRSRSRPGATARPKPAEDHRSRADHPCEKPRWIQAELGLKAGGRSRSA